MTTHCSFLPWVRQGVLAGLQTPDPLHTGSLKGVAQLPIQLELKTSPQGQSSQIDPINVDLQLYSPGDIIGVDRRQIIRTTPQPHTQDFLPNYFAAIEFDRPDFPWLFTPAKAIANTGQLRPWLCLIVVKKQDGVSIGTRSGHPLPVLEIRDPAIAHKELPDLSESWAWAHGQVIHTARAQDLAPILGQQPDLSLSRLICPRRLEPNVSYIACLVPAFEVGRKVGLNLNLSEQEADPERQILEPAWTVPDPDDPSSTGTQVIDLPLYHHWEFRTGPGGDFEDLAQKLRPQTYENLGSRKLFVDSTEISELSDLGVVDFKGVFHSVQSEPPLSTPAEDLWQQELRAILRGPEAVDSSDPVVGPPIYAQFQRSVQRLSESAPWMQGLNLNVRHRAAAGLGVYLVQTLQEELMHSAWEQLEAVQQAQQRKRQQELGTEVNDMLYNKHFEPAVNSVLYQLSAPAHSRLLRSSVAASPQTYRGWAFEQQIPTGGTTSTFRKVARVNGPIAKRMHPAATLSQPIPVAIAQPEQTTPFALDQSHKKLGKIRLDLIGQQHLWAAQSGNDTDSAALDRMNIALEHLNTHFKAIADAAPIPTGGSIVPFNQAFGEEESNLKNQLSSSPVPQSDGGIIVFRQQQTLASTGQDAPVLEPPIPHPTFPQAMYELLQEFLPDFLLPGGDRIQDNTVCVLDINREFIEAFMVGLNHEMSRELLWRNYPTDQRGTYFQNFWSYNQADLKKIHQWSFDVPLGTTLAEGWQTQTGNNTRQLALVIRSELLRRFPNTVIYAIKAATQSSLSVESSDRRYPIHQGALTDDTIFLLFDLDAEEVAGTARQPGWFFIFQQQPTESQFGLDSSAPSAVSQWRHLAWEHVGTQPGAYLSIAQAAEQLTQQNIHPPGPEWGFNSAHMAEILWQQPYQLGIHGSILLPSAQP